MSDEVVPPRTKVLKNGAIYNLDTKRIMDSRGVTTKFDSAKAVASASLRYERKRERIIAGANAIAAEGGRYDGTDLDYVEAIAEAMAQKAFNVDDPKAVDAARFLLQESGLSERAEQAVQQGRIEIGLDDRTARLLEAVAQAQAALVGGEVIDAQAADVEGAGGEG